MPDYGIKEYCGSCGAIWKGGRDNGWCCSSPGLMSTEYCATCMGTGGVDLYTCKDCKGSGEKSQ